MINELSPPATQQQSNAMSSTPEIKDGESNSKFIEKADVVISLNGRDAGKRFLIVGTEGDYSMIADGKSRKIDKPKRKKNKHLKLEDRVNGQIAEKLINGVKVTNNEIRRALAQYAADHGEKEVCSYGEGRHDRA